MENEEKILDKQIREAEAERAYIKALIDVWEKINIIKDDKNISLNDFIDGLKWHIEDLNENRKEAIKKLEL